MFLKEVVPRSLGLSLNPTSGRGSKMSPLSELIFAFLSLVRSLVFLDKTEDMLFMLKWNLCFILFVYPSLGKQP